MGSLAYRGETFTPEKLPAAQLGQIIDMVQAGDLTGLSHPLTCVLLLLLIPSQQRTAKLCCGIFSQDLPLNPCPL